MKKYSPADHALRIARNTYAGGGDVAKKVAKTIKAYHSSPHDFDKFDLSKIGTGGGDLPRLKEKLSSFENALEAMPPESRNYVVFDDKIIDIAKKYGIGLPAAAALYQTMNPNGGQAQAAETTAPAQQYGAGAVAKQFGNWAGQTASDVGDVAKYVYNNPGQTYDMAKQAAIDAAKWAVNNPSAAAGKALEMAATWNPLRAAVYPVVEPTEANGGEDTDALIARLKAKQSEQGQPDQTYLGYARGGPIALAKNVIKVGNTTYSPQEIRAVLQKIASMGINKDKMLAQITPREAAILKMHGGSGRINPRTGLPSFDDGGGGDGGGDSGDGDSGGGYGGEGDGGYGDSSGAGYSDDSYGGNPGDAAMASEQAAQADQADQASFDQSASDFTSNNNSMTDAIAAALNATAPSFDIYDAPPVAAPTAPSAPSAPSAAPLANMSPTSFADPNSLAPTSVGPAVGMGPASFSPNSSPAPAASNSFANDMMFNPSAVTAPASLTAAAPTNDQLFSPTAPDVPMTTFTNAAPGPADAFASQMSFNPNSIASTPASFTAANPTSADLFGPSPDVSQFAAPSESMFDQPAASSNLELSSVPVQTTSMPDDIDWSDPRVADIPHSAVLTIGAGKSDFNPDASTLMPVAAPPPSPVEVLPMTPEQIAQVFPSAPAATSTAPAPSTLGPNASMTQSTPDFTAALPAAQLNAASPSVQAAMTAAQNAQNTQSPQQAAVQTATQATTPAQDSSWNWFGVPSTSTNTNPSQNPAVQSPTFAKPTGETYWDQPQATEPSPLTPSTAQPTTGSFGVTGPSTSPAQMPVSNTPTPTIGSMPLSLGAANSTGQSDQGRALAIAARAANRQSSPLNAIDRALGIATRGVVTSDISDRSNYARAGQPLTGPPQGVVFHHTASNHTAPGTVDTLNARGLGVQYVIDRNGSVHQSLPAGSRGTHMLPSRINDLNNGNTIGVEVSAHDNRDVTQQQVSAAQALYNSIKSVYADVQPFGHGELNPGHRQATEGMSIVNAIRNGAQQATRPSSPLNIIPPAGRNLATYMGRDPSLIPPLDIPNVPGRASGGRVDANPTEAQKEAGNYAKQHISFQGLPISIENKKGSDRKGVDQNGKPWSVKMPYDYGYVKRTEGADGDHVDVCIGPDKTSNQVFVVDQQDHKTNKFDEHKAMLGFHTREEAIKHYYAGFSDGKGPQRLKLVVRMSVEEFKRWLKHCDTTKPTKHQDHIDEALAAASKARATK